MKTIKTLFAILFLSTFFIACEADSASEEVGIEDMENVFSMNEEEEGATDPQG